MPDTRVSDVLRLASNDERLQQGGQRDYVLSEVRAAFPLALELEQQVESLRAELARANEDLAQHSENWRVKAGHLEDERHGLRAANEATWSELVKRGLASEIGPGKLRSLRADSKIHAECEKRNAELTEDRDAFKLAMESCQEDVVRFHTSLEETEGQRDALLADKERHTEALNASQALVDAMGTCHHCGCAIIVEPIGELLHCEDCPSGCEHHDAPDCIGLCELYRRAKNAIDAARKPVSQEPKV